MKIGILSQEKKSYSTRCLVDSERWRFQAQIHRGGTAVPEKITSEERRIAVRAAHVMGFKVAGVDLLRSSRRPLVIEVNFSPGLEAIETATEKDIAGSIIEFIEN